MRASLAWLLLWVPLSCGTNLPLQESSRLTSQKSFVVACNAYADGRSAVVGVRSAPGPDDGPGSAAVKRPLAFVRRKRQKQRQARTTAAVVRTEGVPWAVVTEGGVAAIQLRPNPGHVGDAAGHAVTAAAAAVYAAAAAAVGSADPPTPLIKARSRLRSAQKLPAHKGSVSPLASAIWVRPLAFGQCDEYYIDLSRRQLFFIAPGSEDATELVPPVSSGLSDPLAYDSKFVDPLAAAAQVPDNVLLSGGGGMQLQAVAVSGVAADRLVAVLVQPEASSAAAAVRSVALVRRTLSNGHPAAELAALDGFTQSPSHSEGPIEAELARMEQKQGLKPLSPLESGAIFRLEDIIEQSSASSEVLASKSMSLGASYAIEPSRFRLMLEDLGGARVLDKRVVAFEGGQAYVAIRVGKGGDSRYPQHLVFHRVEDGKSD